MTAASHPGPGGPATIPVDRRVGGPSPTTLRIAALLARRGGGRQWTVLGLTAVGVMAATVLALLALSVSPALGARGDRTAWREPTPADPATATAVQSVRTEPYRGDDITVVDLAPTGVGTPPVPPGVTALPGPGEMVVSPAMARRLADDPTTALADRYPGPVVGTIGPDGLAIADDLVVVVGWAAGDLPLAVDPAEPVADGAEPDVGGAVPVASFATTGPSTTYDDYRVMAQIAAVLLVVPTVLLVGALARLTAAQREQRLAALRLAGATPGLVVAITALETGLAALVGAAAGAVAYVAVLPSAAAIPLAGDRFAVADLRLGTGALALAVAVVPVLAAVSATVALRKVVIGPLGVTHRRAGRRPRAVRLVAVPAAWLMLVVAADGLREGGSAAPVLLGLGAVVGTLAVLGPWATWLVGWAMARLGRRPAPVLAGRRITDDARGTYRTVSGMVMAGLIAGFLFGTIPTIRATDEQADRLEEATDLSFSIDADREDAVTAAVAAAAPTADLVWDRDTTSGPDGETAFGTLRADAGTDPEVVRTAILRTDPDAWLWSPSDLDGELTLLVEDLRRASVVMSLAALALATVATAIGSTASILDQRVTLARLRLAGTDIGVLQRARRWQAVVPLGLASIGAMASGAAAAQVLMVAVGARPDQVRPPELPPMVALGLAALAAGAAAVALTRPVLVTATRAVPSD